MNHRSLAAAAAAAVALLVPIGAACSGDDDDSAVLQTHAPDEGTRPTTTQADDDSETTGTTESTGSDTNTGNSRGDVPADAALDVSVRTPGGVTLNITRLSFDGGDILVDAEFKNGQADYEIYLWQGYPTYDVHLVDDAGQAYNFIKPDDASSPLSQGQIVLQPGESLSGTFAFRGPLAGQPDQISLVTNLYDDSIPSYRLEDQTEGNYPAFVVPMDLTWS